MLRNTHEDVLPPIPLQGKSDLSPPMLVPVPITSAALAITGIAAQQHWHTTISAMKAQAGANLTDLQYISDQITYGVTIPLIGDPPHISYPNTPTVMEHADAVRSRLTEYIAIGAVIILPSDHIIHGESVQPLHVIIKDKKKPRLVIDLSRNLNSYLEYKYFRYSGVEDAVEASYPGCWYGKLDLSNCYLSFPLHPSVRRYFIFRFEGVLYQFTSMPFGLSTAPRECTLLLSVLSYALTQLCIVHVRYLDDIFIIGNSEAQVAQQLSTAQQEITKFGLVVNTEKTEGPAQCLSFLGILIDSVSRTLSCTTARVVELTSLLTSMSNARSLTRRQCESLIGKLSFAALVLPGARPFMRRILDTAKACTGKSSHSHVHIDPGFLADVQFWLLHLRDWNGTQQWRSPRASPFCFASDASLQGFGFYFESAPTLHSNVDSPPQPSLTHASTMCSLSTPTPPGTVDITAWPDSHRLGATFSGVYSTKHAEHHQSHKQIAWCELLAVIAAATTYAPLLKNQSLLFYVDNNTDVHIINRQATRSKQLAASLRHLYAIALKHNISIRAEHRAGVYNTLADFLSRPALHQHQHVQQWKLTHPAEADRLSSVSVVHSELYLN